MTIIRCFLLAEDEPNDVFLFQHALAQAEVKNPLYTVSDGQEAIEYLSGAGKFSDRNHFPFPSLLILDVKMPRQTGMDVLQWLRQDENLRCLPTIVLSSSAHPDDVDKAYQLGANAFIVKPSSVGSRLELARMLKDFWLGLNQVPAICQ